MADISHIYWYLLGAATGLMTEKEIMFYFGQNLLRIIFIWL
jgi:hypothetical protein